MTRILCLNPGSTSTKAALFEDNERIFAREAPHPKEDMAAFPDAMSQLDYRRQALDALLDDLEPGGVDAVAGRGGLLHPVPGGAFAVNRDMLADLGQARYGDHACNLGAFLARDFAAKLATDPAKSLPCLVADPVVTDEMLPLVKLTGLKGLARRSVFHALSQRGAAREAAERLGVPYDTGKFLVAHLGGGISIGAHVRGRVVDVINALDGEGPMSPERTGLLPLVPLLDRMAAGEADPVELKRTVLRLGGLYSHLGTNDLRRALDMARQDDSSLQVLEAMAYSIARAVASLAPALRLEDPDTPADAVVLTGGLARSDWLVARLDSLTAWLGPVIAVRDEVEMRAMAQSALDALSGKAEIQTYSAM